MPDDEAVAALIERIVAGAHVPGRAEREDLRRELSAHFEDAAASPDAIGEAVRRFGAEAMITESLRRVYRRDRLFLYLAKIAASIVAPLGAALLIEVLVNLRLGTQTGVWSLAPGFPHAAVLSVGVVLALVAAWEASRRPFRWSRALVAITAYAVVCALARLAFANGARSWAMATILVVLGRLCSELRPRPADLLITFGVFAAALYGTHLLRSVAFGPGRALLASAVLVGVWTSTVLILARVDRAFGES